MTSYKTSILMNWKNTEMRERLQLFNEMRDYIGKFYSLRYVRKNVLKQNEKEIEDMDN